MTVDQGDESPAGRGESPSAGVAAPWAAGADDRVVFYGRPGCVFWVALRRGLRRAGVVCDEINIWQDPTAAALVRAASGGHETVPTVVVAGRALVNPGVGDVVDPLPAANPDLVLNPPGRARRLWSRPTEAPRAGRP